MKNNFKKALFSAIAIFGLLCQLPKNVTEDEAFNNVAITQNVRNPIEASDGDSTPLYEYYELQGDDESYSLDAIEKVDSSETANLAIGVDSYYASYSFSYDLLSETVSSVVTISADDAIYGVENIYAYPFRYADSSVDALIFLPDGSTIYLSEISNGETSNCSLALALGISFASLLSALIAAAKAAVLITAIIAIGSLTVEAIQMTKERMEERSKAAESERTKRNPSCYYPATRKEGKLLIASAAQTLLVAAKHITMNVDFWSPFDYTAKALVISASGGYEGPEIDKDPENINKTGYYKHYHLRNRMGGHSFFGGPSEGVY